MGEHARRPGTQHVVGSGYAGDGGSKVARSDCRVSREVEVQASVE